MSPWSHVILESYCTFSFMSKKTWTTYPVEIIDGKIKYGENIKKVNEDYIDKEERPKWCKDNNKERISIFRCLCNGKYEKRCRFFAFSNADRRDYTLLTKGFKRRIEELEKRQRIEDTI